MKLACMHDNNQSHNANYKFFSLFFHRFFATKESRFLEKEMSLFFFSHFSVNLVFFCIVFDCCDRACVSKNKFRLWKVRMFTCLPFMIFTKKRKKGEKRNEIRFFLGPNSNWLQFQRERKKIITKKKNENEKFSYLHKPNCRFDKRYDDS